MRDIDDIVKDEIIDKINNVLKVTAASNVVDEIQVVEFCDMKYLRLYRSITLGEVNYTVISVDGNEVTLSVLVGMTPLEVGNLVTIPIPYYFRGTPKATNSEWKIFSDDEREKLPMIWFVNPVAEIFFRQDPRERSSDIRLFLLCSADFENDLTKNFREKNVTPLMALAEEISNAVDSNPANFKKLEEFNTRDFSKFGVEDSTGVIKSIIDSKLSGVDFKFKLETLTQNCNC